MSLSKKTRAEINRQRNLIENRDNASFGFSYFIDYQWGFRIREQQQANIKRKEQWAIKLRFIRSDIKLISNASFTPSFIYGKFK